MKAAAGGRPVEILVLPPHRKWPAWSAPQGELESDGQAVFRLLAERGFTHRRLDPGRFPWNPFGRSYPALMALDPLRALRVLLFHRRAAIVLCFYESSALLVLLLRRLFFFRGKVAVWDLGVLGTWRLRDAILRRVVPRADALLPLNTRQIPELRSLARPDALIHPVLMLTRPAFYRAAEDRPEGYILAVGDDRSRDYATLLAALGGIERDAILRTTRAAEDRVAYPRVRVLREPLSLEQYRDLIAGAMLVVLPLSPVDSPGGVTALVEAMSCAKPVIVSHSPGLTDYVRDGENCLVVPPGDPRALHRAIVSLIQDAARRKQLGAGARRFIEEVCSPECGARNLDTVFRLLLDRGGPAPGR